MDKLKEPAVLISTTNLALLIGAVAYFYKQGEALKQEQLKLSNNLTAIVRRLQEVEKSDQGKGEALHALNNQVKDLTGRVESAPTFDTFLDLDTDVEELVATLADNDINCNRPSKEVYRPRKPYSKSARRVPSSASARDSGRDERSYKREPVSAQSAREIRDDFRRDYRDDAFSARESRDLRDTRDDRRDYVREPQRSSRMDHEELDNVEDIISQFRAQPSVR